MPAQWRDPDKLRDIILRSGLSVPKWARTVAHVHPRTVWKWLSGIAPSTSMDDRAVTIPRGARLFLLIERRRNLMRELAPILNRVGPMHPTRAIENARRRKARKLLRDQLQHTERQIVIQLLKYCA